MSALSFYDHARQPYAESVPINNAAEFMVGDYGEDGDVGVGTGGEFKIILHRFQHEQVLHPQVCVFNDAIDSFMIALGMGLGSVLRQRYVSADGFSRALLGIGLADRSANPLVS